MKRKFKTLEEVRVEHVQNVLKYTGFNRTKTARILDVDYQTVVNMIRRYGLAVSGKETNLVYTGFASNEERLAHLDQEG